MHSYYMRTLSKLSCRVECLFNFVSFHFHRKKEKKTCGKTLVWLPRYGEWWPLVFTSVLWHFRSCLPLLSNILSMPPFSNISMVFCSENPFFHNSLPHTPFRFTSIDKALCFNSLILLQIHNPLLSFPQFSVGRKTVAQNSQRKQGAHLY